MTSNEQRLVSRATVHLLMSSTTAIAIIRELIEEAFQQTESEYLKEIEDARRLTRTDFALLRPVFIAGNPGDVEPGQYLMFVGLNPKYDEKSIGVARHHELINGSATSNEQATLRYFSNHRIPHKYFRTRAKVLAAVMKSLPPSALDIVPLLQSKALFLESVPYSSAQSPGMQSRRLRELPNVARCHKAIVRLIAEHTPAAVILDGNTTHWLLDSPEKVERQLASVTKSGPCTVSVSQFGQIPVIRTSFIGSRRGPNSNAQLQDLGDVVVEAIEKVRWRTPIDRNR
jgi:hypothetical protein